LSEAAQGETDGAGEEVPNAQGRRLSWLTKGISITVGMMLAGVAAYAVTNWVVGLTSGSSGEAQSATIGKLTITATSSAAPGDLLDPGDSGDVVISIANANPYPVTITAVQLPTSTTYATGYTSSALTTTQAGCLSTTPSDVTWNFSTTTSGSSHTLSTALTVAASGKPNNPLVVTLGDDALMSSAAPLACANTFFSMPSLTGITATGGGTGTATTSPATDGWTS
jgi:hypothetical protein